MAKLNERARRSNADRTAATRAALVAAGEELFGTRGYAEVSIDAIVQQAGVTRGALYHHFSDKRDLFRAVVEKTESDIMPRIGKAFAEAEGPWDVLVRGSEQFLDICLEDRFQRIVLIDAAAVLGPVEQQEIGDRYGTALLRATLTGLIEIGELADVPVDALSRMLTGALIAGANVIAEAEDQQAARRDVGLAIDALLAGLRA